MSTCTGQPISWLRLERHALGELPDAEIAEIARHLAACPACSECFARVEHSPPGELPAFDMPAPPVARIHPRRPLRKPATVWPWWAGLASAAAAVLLLVRPAAEPPARRHVKGGDFALELVRVDANDRLQEPSHFAVRDRFKALLTCPTGWRGSVGIAVYQAGKLYTPLAIQSVDECGNRRALAGAFKLDGEARALVCASFAASEAEWRARVAVATSPAPGSVCTPLEPATDSER